MNRATDRSSCAWRSCGANTGISCCSATGPGTRSPYVPTALLAPQEKRPGTGGNEHRDQPSDQIVRTAYEYSFDAGTPWSSITLPCESRVNVRVSVLADERNACQPRGGRSQRMMRTGLHHPCDYDAPARLEVVR